ncbi:DsbC family protein [Undibacterium terreum]|uniref:Thiol:disulfide interchange protein n=1 Tax=Undibacterium terreum TaxID=1224302 RepID=A0A916UIF4_9BURK|nr:DsbC family protein [Undibacterium terreum]GGC74743.1 thiol:disulfide interchange protein DsbC [Undibacterium terreum]
MAQASWSVTPQETARIASQLNQVSPGLKIDKITKLEKSDFYEVIAGRTILYVDSSMHYVFQGNLIDIDNKINLTEKRSEELNKIEFSSLPVADAIVTVKGNGKRKLAIFSDPDCPYCKKLETELASLTDVTIYTYLFPIISLHPNSVDRATSVWCAPDRAKAWSIAMKSGDLAKAQCNTPIARTIDFGKKVGINATPTMIFSNGKRVPGMIPAEQIDKLLGS